MYSAYRGCGGNFSRKTRSALALEPAARYEELDPPRPYGFVRSRSRRKIFLSKGWVSIYAGGWPRDRQRIC